jgi:hypothetical protein
MFLTKTSRRTYPEKQKKTSNPNEKNALTAKHWPFFGTDPEIYNIQQQQEAM